jgi:hypothetical protein
MALVVPIASSASVIENILFKVRRGIALSRNASQANPNTGVMVDLPEKIDFDMTILKTHQSSAFQRIVGTTASEGASESRVTISNEASVTSKASLDLESTSSREQARGQDSEQAVSKGGSNEGGTQGSRESGNGSEGETSNERGNEKSQSGSTEGNRGNGTAIDNEVENRCTYQKHTANRLYDKFDTDTGQITGISL